MKGRASVGGGRWNFVGGKGRLGRGLHGPCILRFAALHMRHVGNGAAILHERAGLRMIVRLEHDLDFHQVAARRGGPEQGFRIQFALTQEKRDLQQQISTGSEAFELQHAFHSSSVFPVILKVLTCFIGGDERAPRECFGRDRGGRPVVLQRSYRTRSPIRELWVPTRPA